MRQLGLLLIAGMGLALLFSPALFLLEGDTGWTSIMMGGCLLSLLGVVLAWSGFARLWVFARFGQGSGSISSAVPIAGEPFLFNYRKPIRRKTTADLTIALVLRDSYTTGEGQAVTTHVRDQLVSFHREKALQLRGGTTLERECQFAIPAFGTAGFATGKTPLSWVLKVHLDPRPGWNWDLWDEFELPLSAVRQLPSVPRKAADEHDHNVVFLGYGLRGMIGVLEVVRDYVPHLDNSQLVGHLKTAPVYLLANVTQDEADTACARLRATGARAEVRRGNPTIATRMAPDLPLPHALPGHLDPSLPRPSYEPETGLKQIAHDSGLAEEGSLASSAHRPIRPA